MPDPTGRKQANRGQFKPGKSGNPSGRPPGVRNHATLLAEKLMAEDVEGVVEAVIKAAKDGDMTACRLILERLVPARRDNPVQIELPKLATAEDATRVLSASVAAMAKGELTPSEAAAVAGLAENFRRALETSEFEARIAKLEQING